MISIIICSRKADISQELKDNIATTIGCEYEIIIIDNSKNQYSIFAAYNEGVKCAKGDVFVFAHEDILFHTVNWGLKMLRIVQDTSIGLVGFAGSHFLPSTPEAWDLTPWTTWYLQSHGGVIDETSMMRDEQFIDAVMVDGFCFFTPASIWKDITFDETSYKGFHFYDYDICMQVLQAHKRVVITKRILIEHFSGGNTNAQWFENQKIFWAKWHNTLPITRGVDMSTADAVRQLDKFFKSKKEVEYTLQRTYLSKAYRIGRTIRSIFKRKNSKK